MRIAQLCFRRYPSPIHVGGGHVRLWQSLCTLRALGDEVHVVVCDPGNERAPELASDAKLHLRLAKGARAVYKRHFTMEASFPKYHRILEIAIDPNGGAVPCAS